MRALIVIIGALIGAAALAQAAAPLPGTEVIDKLLQPGNLAASTLLALNVIGFIRGWVVPSWVYKAEKERADRMEDRAWKATEALVHAVGSVERTAEAMITSKKTESHP